MKTYLIEMVQHHQNLITEYQNNVSKRLNQMGYENTTPVLSPTLFADQVKKTDFTDNQIMLIQQLLVNAFQAGQLLSYTDNDIENEVNTQIEFQK